MEQTIITVELVDGIDIYEADNVYQYDRGDVLKLIGLTLPTGCQVHFGFSANGKSKPVLLSNGEAVIPQEFTNIGAPIYAWVYVSGEDYGATKKTIKIPVAHRGEITDEEPTPEQESTIDQYIALLQETTAEVEENYTELSGEVGDLKSAIITETTPAVVWEQGSYNSNGVKNQSSSTVYIRTASIVPMLGGGTISVSNGYQFRTYFYSADGTYIARDEGWKTQERTIPANSYIAIVMQIDGSATVSPSDASNLTIKEKNYTFAPKVDEVYIATTGSDSTGDGTYAAPYATFGKALSTGLHTIKVAVGVYDEVVTINDRDQIKIVPYPRPAYDSSVLVPRPQIKKLEINRCRFIEIEDLIIDADGNDSACFQMYSSYAVKVTNCEAKNGAKGGFVVYDSNVEFYNCIAHDIGSTETPVSDGFNFHNAGSSIMNGCIAYNCTDDGASHHERTIGVIENCEFYNCGSSERGSGIAPIHNSIIRVSNCRIHDCNRGLECADSTSPAFISGTVIYNNTVDIYATSPVIIYNTKYTTTNSTGAQNITDLSAAN